MIKFKSALFCLMSFWGGSLLMNAQSHLSDDKLSRNSNATEQLLAQNIVSEKGATDKSRRSITGTVVDERGEALIGVAVSLKGTSEGDMTDIDGKFTLKALAGDVLVLNYIGYDKLEVPVTNSLSYNIKMKSTSIVIPDIVVTALGIKREKKALSYNAQEVKTDDITAIKDANFVNALNGKVAGVNVNASSSGVGGASKVVMRGVKSIGQSNNAMYVIDGVPMFNSSGRIGESKGTEFDSRGGTESAADINPEDIESMTVLNGAAASALYGSDAANGVIMITTKRGKAGKTSVVFSQNTEFLSPFVLPKFQNYYGTGLNGINTNETDYSWGEKLNSSNRYGYDPKKDYFQTGVVTTESISLSTGTDVNQTYASASAVNSEGIIPNNTYDRLNFTIRNSTSMLNDKLKLDLGASYVKQKDKNMTNQGIYQNPLVSAYLFPRGADWNDVKMYEQWDPSRGIYTQRWDYGLGGYVGQNPYWTNYRNLRTNTKDRYMLNGSLSYQVLDWLNISGRASSDFSENRYQERLFAGTNTTLTDGSLNGLYELSSTRERQTYADLLANVNRYFLDGDLSLNASVGASINDFVQDYMETSGRLSADAIPNVFSIMQIDKNRMKAYESRVHDQTQSVFFSAEFGYKSTYYLTLTGRNDWPSQLAGENSSKTSFFYPSVGTSVLVSEIIQMPKQIEYFKLRASYASVGSPFQRYLAQKYHSWSDKVNGYDPNYDHFPINFLDPQKTDSWELGVTLKFLKNFNLDVGLYTAKTYNQVFNANISASSGYNNYYIQSGSVTNKGIELGLGYQNTFGKVTWASNYTLTSNSNKINDLVGSWVNPITGESYPDDKLILKTVGDTRFILKEGGTLGDLYSLTDLKRDEDGKIFVDANGHVSKIDVAANPIKLGSVLPKANMSWRNDFSWNNFNLGFMLSARLGGVVYSGTQGVLDSQGVSEASAIARDNGGVVVNGGDIVDAQNWYQTIGTTSSIPQFYTYSATNVRLQEASIGYTFSKSKLWNIGDLTVSLIGRNLLMIYNKAPFDPETTATTGNNYQGIDYFMMPSNRSVGFNVKMRF